mgnify:CR=1 FL=1
MQTAHPDTPRTILLLDATEPRALDEWVERGDVGLFEIISHVLVHELGHHMGLDDDRIDVIESMDD